MKKEEEKKLSTKRNCSQRITSQRYWENMLIRNNSEWLLTHSIWWSYWGQCLDSFKNEYNGKPVLFSDYKKRGFILFTKKSDLEIYFALVDYKYRNKGVLKKMINKIKKIYSSKLNISLESLPCSEIVWKKLGFSFILQNDFIDDDGDDDDGHNSNALTKSMIFFLKKKKKKT